MKRMVPLVTIVDAWSIKLNWSERELLLVIFYFSNSRKAKVDPRKVKVVIPFLLKSRFLVPSKWGEWILEAQPRFGGCGSSVSLSDLGRLFASQENAIEVNLENKQPSGHYERTDFLLPTFNRMAIKRYSSPTGVELRLQNYFYCL